MAGSFLSISSAILNTAASLVSPPAELSFGWILRIVSRTAFDISV